MITEGWEAEKEGGPGRISVTNGTVGGSWCSTVELHCPLRPQRRDGLVPQAGGRWRGTRRPLRDGPDSDSQPLLDGGARRLTIADKRDRQNNSNKSQEVADTSVRCLLSMPRRLRWPLLQPTSEIGSSKGQRRNRNPKARNVNRPTCNMENKLRQGLH